MTYTLPISVYVNGQEYTIRKKGDFRMVLDCFEALNDIELTKSARLITCLIIFYEDFNSIEDINEHPNDVEELVKKMVEFFNIDQPEDACGKSVNYKLIDWQQDAPIICSAVNKVAGKEIRAEEYLHWWTFLGYYMSVGESALSTIVSIRSKIIKGKKLEKYEQEFKRDNPQYFKWNSKTAEEMELDRLAMEMWNSDT